MRRILVSLVVLAALAAAAWSGVWFYFAGQIEAGVDRWAADRQAEGLKVAHGPITVSGFPLTWQVTIAQPDLADTGLPPWSWRGDAVVATIRPWDRGEVPLVFPGDHVLTTGTGAAARTLYANAQIPEGWAWIDAGGRIVEVGLDLRGLDARLWINGPSAQVGRARATLRPRQAGDPARANEIADIGLDLGDLTLPQAPPGGFGREISRVIADLTLKGKLFRLALPDAVAAWRDDGGTIEMKRGTLIWGPLTVDGNGTLALDAMNRPIGAGTARVRGFGETIDALVAGGAVQARDGAIAKIALNLLARPGAAGQGRELEVPLTAQNGQLYAAGFSLLRVRPLRLE